jgi:hypothetical protein
MAIAPARCFGKEDQPQGGQRLTVGPDVYNLLNNDVTLAFNRTYSATTAGWLTPATYMNPRVYRLNAEFAW